VIARQDLRRRRSDAQHQRRHSDIACSPARILVRGVVGTQPAKDDSLERKAIMLWTLAVLLVVLWALGLVTSYTMGGFIHILLVLAVVVVVVRIIQGRRIT
jgi:Flp pilus assembly protein TadB